MTNQHVYKTVVDFYPLARKMTEEEKFALYARLHEAFGQRVFNSMYPLASKTKYLRQMIDSLNYQINHDPVYAEKLELERVRNLKEKDLADLYKTS